jgi:hypothetical protein
MGRHFISYSRRDGQEFSDWLYRAIWRITPQSPPWMDRCDLVAGFSYDDRLEQQDQRSGGEKQERRARERRPAPSKPDAKRVTSESPPRDGGPG